MRIIDIMRQKKAEASNVLPISPRQQALAEWLEEAAQDKEAVPSSQLQFQSFLPLVRSLIRSMSDSDIDFLVIKLNALTNKLNAADTRTIETGCQ